MHPWELQSLLFASVPRLTSFAKEHKACRDSLARNWLGDRADTCSMYETKCLCSVFVIRHMFVRLSHVQARCYACVNQPITTFRMRPQRGTPNTVCNSILLGVTWQRSLGDKSGRGAWERNLGEGGILIGESGPWNPGWGLEAYGRYRFISKIIVLWHL